MQLVTTPISNSTLKTIAEQGFGDLVKAVIDISKHCAVIDADLHADEEQYLLSLGSQQSDLWGINIYPNLSGTNRIEFDSMINVRPQQKNFSRLVEDASIRQKILDIANNLFPL